MRIVSASLGALSPIFSGSFCATVLTKARAVTGRAKTRIARPMQRVRHLLLICAFRPKSSHMLPHLLTNNLKFFFPSLWYSILKDCSFKPREDLVKELQRRDAMMERLTRKNEGLVQRVSKLEQVCPYVFLSPFTFLPCRLSIWATIPYTYFGFPWSGTAN